MKGLEEIKKNFVPANKTDPKISQIVLTLIRNNPVFGPREIKYRLDELGFPISESAVYNIMRRNALSTRTERIRFSRKKVKNISKIRPDLNGFSSGECWLFWASYYGDFQKLGPVYEFSIYDYTSRIACSRLYGEVSLDNYIDLLSGVAIPVAQSLKLEPKTWCFFEEESPRDKRKNRHYHEFMDIAQSNGFNTTLHVFPNNDEDRRKWINPLREAYTRQCLTVLMPLIQQGLSLKELKLHLQNQIRKYNIMDEQMYPKGQFTPVGYHNYATKTDMILPLWAYLERDY